MKFFLLIIGLLIITRAVIAQDSVIAFFDEEKELYGFRTKSGKIIVKPIYKMVFDSDEVLIPVSKGGKWGFVNSNNGKLVIPCKYDEIERFFQDGYALLSLNGSLISINKRGEIYHLQEGVSERDLHINEHRLLDQFFFDKIRIHPGALGEDGYFYCRSKNSKKWGLFQIYEGGELVVKTIVPAEYDSISKLNWNDHFIPVFKKGKVGIYQIDSFQDEEPRLSIVCQYDNHEIMKVSSPNLYWYGEVSILALKNKDKWAWVDWFSGELLTPFEYNDYNDLPAIKTEWLRF